MSPPILQARDYQNEAVQAVLSAERAGDRNVLGVAATGGGKTVIMLMLASYYHGTRAKKTVIIAHRDELLTQPIERVRAMFPSMRATRVQADENDFSGDVIVASIQSLVTERRLNVMKDMVQRGEIGLVCIDEAHHALADNTYGTVIRALGLEPSRTRGPMLLGVTATPNRADKIGLSSVFPKEVFRYDIRYLMERGYLCDLRAIRVNTKTDISHVRTRMGDFQQKQLQDAVNNQIRNELAAHVHLEHASGMPLVAFCAGVDHAKEMAEVFTYHGIRTRAIYGAMDGDERRRVIAAYEAGDLDGLTNFNVLTEGWDAPRTTVMHALRPTKSESAYIQMAGRILRPYSGILPNGQPKTHGIMFDYVDVSTRHGIVQATDLFGLVAGQVRDGEGLLEATQRLEAEEAAEKEAFLKLPEIDLTDVDIWSTDAMLDNHLQEHDVFRTEQFVWKVYTAEKPIIERKGKFPTYGKARKLYAAQMNDTDTAIVRFTNNGGITFYSVNVIRDTGALPVTANMGGGSLETQVAAIRGFEEVIASGHQPHFYMGRNAYDYNLASEPQLKLLGVLFSNVAKQRGVGRPPRLEAVLKDVYGENGPEGLKKLTRTEVSDLIALGQFLLIRPEKPASDLRHLLDVYLAPHFTVFTPTDLDDLFAGLGVPS